MLIHPAQIVNRDYSIYTFNQNAPRVHRREIFAALKKTFAENFEGRDAHKDQEHFSKKTEQIYQSLEQQFIDEIYDEEKMPIFEFDINVNEAD